MKIVTLNQFAPWTEEFFFTTLTDPLTRDAIVICNPSDAICISPVFLHSKKTLEEHIEYIQKIGLRKL